MRGSETLVKKFSWSRGPIGWQGLLERSFSRVASSEVLSCMMMYKPKKEFLFQLYLSFLHQYPWKFSVVEGLFQFSQFQLSYQPLGLTVSYHLNRQTFHIEVNGRTIAVYALCNALNKNLFPPVSQGFGTMLQKLLENIATCLISEYLSHILFLSP